MDTVRFGRVLGQGARQAAKTLVSAVDAATAPNPAQPMARNPVAPRPASAAPVAQPTAALTPAQPSFPATAATQPAAAPAPTILPPATPRAEQTPRPTANASPHPRSPASVSPRGLAEGSRRFGRAIWAPAVRLSGVLWLELTGVFFALFALVAGIAVWRLRPAFGTLPAPSDDRTRLLFAAGMVLVFGYFSVSSFLKARRRSRRP